MLRLFHNRFTVLRTLLLTSAATLLVACAAQVRVAPPVYGPPVAVVQVRVAPPPLPVYEQPLCPVAGWIWTPGYWRWGPAGYFWVPGTWVAPPRVGLLWTPGYWGFVGGLYVWHAGYWGPHVGFYGGVNYGFGYDGDGYVGGRWIGREFAYNRAVTRVNVTIIHNTYRETVINRINVTRVSYNGGPGGVSVVPTAQDRRAEQERHFPPTALQRTQVRRAQREPGLLARENRGHPSIAATPRPGAFHARGVVHSQGALRTGYAHRAQGRGGPSWRRGQRGGYAPGARRPQWRKAAAAQHPRHPRPKAKRKRQWWRKHP
jgi:hypothetical protein